MHRLYINWLLSECFNSSYSYPSLWIYHFLFEGYKKSYGPIEQWKFLNFNYITLKSIYKRFVVVQNKIHEIWFFTNYNEIKYSSWINVSIFSLHATVTMKNKLTFTSIIPYTSDIVPLPTGAHISPNCVRTDLVTDWPIRTAALINI